MNKIYQNLIDYLSRNQTKPLFVSISVFVVACILISILHLIYWYSDSQSDQFWQGIFIESHGMLMDVIVVILIYNTIEYFRQKKLDSIREAELKDMRIVRYLEELEDYRPWRNEEATWRLRGLIKRLNREGKTCFFLEGAYFVGAELNKINCKESNLRRADFKRAELNGSCFDGATLDDSDFQYAWLHGAQFKGANLMGANFQEAVLHSSNFKGANLPVAILAADLSSVNFEGATLYGASFKYRDFMGEYIKVDLTNTNFKGANLENAILEIHQLKQAIFSQETIMMDGTHYDDGWAERIKDSSEEK